MTRLRLLIPCVCSVAAGAAQANDLSVSPSITLSASKDAAGVPFLTGSWQIGCSIDDAQTTYGWGGIQLIYSATVGAATEVEVPNPTGVLGGEAGSTTNSGALEVHAALGGSRITPRFVGVFCHHDQQNSPLVTVNGPDFLVPPVLSVVFAYNPARLNDPPSVSGPIAADVVPDVPVGQPLVMSLNVNAHPQDTEDLELHYEGAGTQFGQVLHDVQKEYDPSKEQITPTTVDRDISVWAVMQPYGVRSNTLKFHVVADPKAPDAGSDVDAGTNPAPSGTKSGCAAAGGGLELPALAALLALLRRQRMTRPPKSS